MLTEDTTTRKKLEKLHGCLNYVSCVEPFGKPFLSHLTTAFAGSNIDDSIPSSPLLKLCLRIWTYILKHNKGISYDFMLDRLRRTEYNIFVDASSTWGIGGCCGARFFNMS